MIPVRYCTMKSYPEELAKIKELFPHLDGKVYVSDPVLSKEVHHVDSPAYFKVNERDGSHCYLILTDHRVIEYEPGFHDGTGTIDVSYEDYEHPDGSVKPYELPPGSVLLDEEELVVFRRELGEVVADIGDLLPVSEHG